MHACVKKQQSDDAARTKDEKDEKSEGGADGFRVRAQR